jgi:hypothetical protein
MEPSIADLKDKLNELISKHNELARAVDNLVQAIDIINATLLAEGNTTKNLDS